MLSGFIIALAHRREIGRPDRLRNYLTRRFIRLFPVYCGCLAWRYVERPLIEASRKLLAGKPKAGLVAKAAA